MRNVVIALVGISTALSACTVQINTGTGSDDTVETTVASDTATTGPVGDTSTAITESVGIPLQDVRAAIVRIEAGPFTEPPATAETATAGASGFFINTSGAILTTNDAVAGAGEIEVFLADDPEPHPATVVATDECYNLAVIDIDATDHVVLPITASELTPGENVTVGGYPAQSGVYMVTDATVTSIPPSVDVPSMAHDALIGLLAPVWIGQAGAPVLTDNGSAEAVTLSLDEEGAYAVPFAAIHETIAALTGDTGEGVLLSIGLNTASFHDETATIGPDGLWVRGVVAGSPAQAAGVEPGDVIVSVGGRDTASASGSDEYCLALEDHTGGGPLPISVFRPADGLFYEGTLGDGTLLAPNGEQWPPTTTTTTTTAPTTTQPSPTSTTTTLLTYQLPPGDDFGGFDWIKTAGSYLLPVDGTYTAYVDVDDAHGVIHSVKPDEWGFELSHDLIPVFPSVDGKTQSGVTLFVLGGDQIEEYVTTWTSPGYQMGIAHRAPGTMWTPETTLERSDWSDRCLDDGLYGTYDGGTYTGVYRFWSRCETDYVDAVKLDIAAWNDDHSVAVWISTLMFTEADYDAFAAALAAHTFDVDQLTAEGF